MLCTAAVAAGSCAAAARVPLDPNPVADLAIAEAVTQSTIERHTRALSSDTYQGRFPGTTGEALTIQYLEREFRRIGLAPGNPNGTYVQPFELLAQHNDAAARLVLADGAAHPLEIPRDALFVVSPGRPATRMDRSDVVFVGYGISAPEYGWDDYAAVDVRGKTVLVLRGEPERMLASAATESDPSFFHGSRLTYHGIVEQKWAVARDRGATAFILVSPSLPGFRNALARSRGEYLSTGRERHPDVLGFFARELTERIFAAAGRVFNDDVAAASRPGFRPILLRSSLSLEVRTSWRRFTTNNVVARLEGADPRMRNEHVILSAHWDAFGVGPPVEGDSIYNGAVDDAAGVAQMLAAAEALASARSRLRRSVLFLVTSAEEHRLSGARAYVERPLYPLKRAVLNVNFDIIHLAGRTHDVTLYGAGRSSLDAELAAAAALQGRRVTLERTPNADTWFHQDHFAFVERGVPALSVAAGLDVVGRAPDFGEARAGEYRARHYHRPSDEVRDDWDWGSIVQDAQLGVILAVRAAGSDRRLVWHDRREFRR